MNRVSIFIHDRSNLTETTTIYPVGHPKRPEGGTSNRLDEARQGMFLRGDIAMINVEYANGEFDQHCIHAKDGQVAWSGMGKYFTPDEQQQLTQIAKRMQANELEYPELKGRFI